MSDPSSLETLLRAVNLTNGSIDITVLADGRWRAGVVRFTDAESTGTGFYSDPVDALRAALIEDERRIRETERQYAAAPKLGDPVVPKPYNDCDYCAGTGHFYGDPELGPCGCQPPATPDNMEDILG